MCLECGDWVCLAAVGWWERGGGHKTVQHLTGTLRQGGNIPYSGVASTVQFPICIYMFLLAATGHFTFYISFKKKNLFAY